MICSTTASTSNAALNENQAGENESKLSLCQNLLKKRLELSKTDPNSKDPKIIASRKELSSQLSELICGPDGVKTLFIAIDQTSDPSFWTTAIPCYSLSSIIVNVPQKNLFSVFTEIRKLMQDELWGNKLSLFLASLIEISEKVALGKASSAADVIFVDFILRPFHRLWEGNYSFLPKNDKNGYWNSALDSSLWIAYCWLKHSAKMKQLNSHLRLDKLFTACMVMSGRICGTLNEDQSKLASKLKSVSIDISSGIIGANGDVSQEKTAQFLVKNFIALSESNLPSFDFAFTTKKLIEVVEEDKETPTARKLIFDEVFLDIQPIDEISTNLDAYVNSLFEFIETMDKKDKAKLLIGLWSECVENWSTFKQDQQWSLSASKWSSIYSSSNQSTSQSIEKRRFVIEYLMSALETLLDSIVDDLDSQSTLKLVHLSKNLISTSIGELNDEFSRLQSLDLKAGLDSVMETRAKTLHLAIGLCGFVLFQSEELSEEMKILFKELIELLKSLLELIDQNKHLPIGELQSVADSAQQILTLSTQFFDDDIVSTKQQPINLRPTTKKPNGLLECLRSVETDYSNEMDGSVEIAERGHTIIAMEKRFRNKCQSEIDSIDGGLTRIFDALADNLRHPDSYVYLAAINALCELSSWHHKICLPKMMFLLKNWDVEIDDEEQDEFEKQGDKWNAIRYQVQMGEAIAKVVYSLGELAPSYFNELSQFFLNSIKHEDQTVSSSALSGLANLILACRGRYFTKIIHELIVCCESKLNPKNAAMVRRASVHLLRSIVTSCQMGVFTDLRESSTKITSLLRRIRALDADPAVRLHADLALLEIETVLNESIVDSLDKHTRVIK